MCCFFSKCLAWVLLFSLEPAGCPGLELPRWFHCNALTVLYFGFCVDVARVVGAGVGAGVDVGAGLDASAELATAAEVVELVSVESGTALLTA